MKNTNITNLCNRALTRWDVDSFINDTLDKNKDVYIQTDSWGFRKIKDMYEGWLNIPQIADGEVYMSGVNPVFLMGMFVATNRENQSGEMRFLNENKEVIGEIVNYSVTF